MVSTTKPVVARSRTDVHTPAAPLASPELSHHVTTFQYTGATGLTVRGPITGRTYRFAKPGNAMVVDERDAPYFGAVPSLRRLPFAP